MLNASMTDKVHHFQCHPVSLSITHHEPDAPLLLCCCRLLLLLLVALLALLAFIVCPAQFMTESLAPLQQQLRRVPQLQQLAQYVETALQPSIVNGAASWQGWGAGTLGFGRQKQQQVRAAWGDGEL